MCPDVVQVHYSYQPWVSVMETGDSLSGQRSYTFSPTPTLSGSSPPVTDDLLVTGFRGLYMGMSQP
jgi:hypothetical protein